MYPTTISMAGDFMIATNSVRKLNLWIPTIKKKFQIKNPITIIHFLEVQLNTFFSWPLYFINRPSNPVKREEEFTLR